MYVGNKSDIRYLLDNIVLYCVYVGDTRQAIRLSTAVYVDCPLTRNCNKGVGACVVETPNWLILRWQIGMKWSGRGGK